MNNDFCAAHNYSNDYNRRYNISCEPKHELADWNCDDPKSPKYIKHKPDFSILDSISEESINKWNSVYKDYLCLLNKIESIKSDYENLHQEIEHNYHEHNNKPVLDNLTLSVIDNSHNHKNIKALDKITLNKIDEWDSKSHEHKNQAVLDKITNTLLNKLINVSKLNVIDNLTSKSKTDVLSANLGRVLNEKIESIENYLEWEEL